MNPQHYSDAMDECIQNCLECHRKCLETLNYSLREGLDHTDHAQLLKNCAAICEVSAQFMISHSDLHPIICGACAEVCSACASSCEDFEEDDFMQDCAEVCRRCEVICREMSGERKDIRSSSRSNDLWPLDRPAK